MNKLTKQWFDEVNTDAMPMKPTDDRVYFKKNPAAQGTTAAATKQKTTKFDKNVAYQTLNTSSRSNNILLESTDDENEYNSNEEDIVIDKLQLKNSYK
jgi:hypothetical protein